MADETDVGSIVAHLRLDGGGEWELTLRRAQEQAEALGRVNPQIRITTNSAELQAQLATIRGELDSLRAENVSLRFDLTQAQADLARLREESRRQGEISGRDFASQFTRNVREALAALPKVDVDANTSPAERRLQEIRAELEELGKRRIGVDIDAAHATEQLTRLQGELEALRRRAGNDITIRVNTATAAARIAALRAQIAGLDGAARGDVGGGSGGLFAAIAIGATTIGPLVAAGTAAVIESAAAAGVAALAYKGLKDQEQEATGVGLALKSTTHGIGAELKALAATAGNEAAPGVLAALTRIKVFIPTMDGTVAGLAHHLGAALNIGTGGTIKALTVMKPLMNDAGTYAERLAQKWADFAASPEFARFIAYAEKELPIVGHDIADLVKGFVDLGTGLQPYGDDLLRIIDLAGRATGAVGKLLQTMNSNSNKSGDKSDIFNFQGRYKKSDAKKNKGVMDYVNIALGAGDPFAKQPAAQGGADPAQTEKEAVAAAQAAAAEKEHQSALAGVAVQYGLSVTAYQAAAAAEAKTNAAREAAIALMKRESDAGGLLKDALDRLNGKQLSSAQAENQFEQALVSMVKKVNSGDAALTGMSSSAIANRGELLSLVTSAEGAAEAYGSLDKSGFKTTVRLQQLKKQTIDNAVAHGEDRAAVTKYIDSVLKIPTTVPTKPDFNAASARNRIEAFRAYLDSLPGTKVVTVRADGTLYAIQQIGQLRTLIEQLHGKTVTITTNQVTGESTVKTGIGGHAGPTATSAYGNIFRAYAQGGMEDHQPQIARSRPGSVRVWAEPETGGEAYIPLANDGRRSRAIAIAKQAVAALGGHASFADGGLVSITPSASSVAAAKAKKAKKAKPVNVPLVVSVGGGAAYGISSYIKGQIPSAKAAMRDLSESVNAAFQMRGAQARVAALKTDLDNLRQDKAAFTGGVTSALMGQVDVTKYGDAQMLADALSNGRGTNAKFAGEEQKLAKEGVPEELIRALTQNGNSAGLDTVAGLAPGSAMLRQIIGQYQAFAGSATRGGAVAGSAAYDSQIRATATKASQAAIDAAHDRAVMLRALAALGKLVQQPSKIVIDGKEVAHVVIASHEFNGVIDDLTGHLVLGRR